MVEIDWMAKLTKVLELDHVLAFGKEVRARSCVDCLISIAYKVGVVKLSKRSPEFGHDQASSAWSIWTFRCIGDMDPMKSKQFLRDS
ncbi:Hypothetical predicted protein [Olea europaea subsp. europaea]|uniref:Uncharacterized protein n=1 Tax=Olea europaea subsp. europaea TaxID=158383 RepID=A0A8S0PY12_OLEEU|nr:Hypothetical predicted protein [Olea europaea subsp. europaea]